MKRVSSVYSEAYLSCKIQNPSSTPTKNIPCYLNMAVKKGSVVVYLRVIVRVLFLSLVFKK
jgi:hypothetical protein